MLQETIKKIVEKKPNVVVMGDLMLDKYILGYVDRVSPEAPVPIVNFIEEKKTLGGCGNVARNLDNLGANVFMISMVGEDDSGDTIIDLLSKRKISVSGILVSNDIKTTEKMRVLGGKQQIVRIDREGNGQNQRKHNDLLNVLSTQKENIQGVIVSDYGKGICSEYLMNATMEIAQSIGIPVFIDPKGVKWQKYRKADLITPNTNEAELVLGRKLHSDKDFEFAGKEICSSFDIKACLITRGSEGMSYISSDEVFHLRSEAKEIFDVSGAGDTVISSVALGLLAEIDIYRVVEFANHAAGIVVGHIGTSAISIDELNIA